MTAQIRKVPRQAFWLFACGLLFSLLIWSLSARFMVQSSAREFEREAATAAALVERRFTRYSDLLYGLQGLFVERADVSRLSFHRYVAALDLAQRFPGVQSMQYLRRVPRGGKAAFESSVRADTSLDPLGYPEFSVRTDGAQTDHWVITFVEPMTGNERAFGLDIHTRPVARDAAAAARDTGDPVMTGRYQLAQDERSRVGLVVYMPVYRTPAERRSVAERRADLAGFVNIVFRPEEVFATVLDETTSGRLQVIVHDLGPAIRPAGAASRENLILAPQDEPATAAGATLRTTPTFIRTTAIAGRHWQITVGKREAEVSAWLHPASLGAFLASVAIFGLLAVILRNAARARADAIDVADRATRDLRKQLSLNEQLIEALPNPLFFKDTQGRYLGCNRAFEDFTGRKKEDFVGKTAADIQDADTARLYTETDQSLIAQPGVQRYEAVVKLPGQDAPRHVQFNKATFQDEEGGVSGLVGVMVDLTDIRAAEANLRKNETQLRLALESAEMATWLWNVGERTFQTSGGFNALFGVKGEATVREFEQFRAAVHPEDRERIDAALKHALIYSDDLRLEMRVVWPDGSTHWIASQGQIIRNPEGRAVSLIGVAMNVTERKLAEQRIAHMAQHDTLTGLPNRLLLKDRIAQAVFHALRAKSRVAVLFIDLDRFKNINDSLGHEAGDKLLQTVAKRIRTCLREADTVSRLGGDEFVIVLPEVHGSHDVSIVAAKILETLSQTYHLQGQDLHVSASIGVALFPEDGEEADTLMRNADAAMYHAKDAGRANYQFFTEHMNVSAHRRVTLEAELRRALDRNELTLSYQPMYALSNGRLIGAEALLRWQHPERGLVSPGEFISVAEDTGLIHQIGEDVLRAACAQARLWQDEALSIRLSINVSVHQLRRKAFLDQLRTILASTSVDPGLLELEITESLIVEDASEALKTLKTLDELGVRLAIDDFGTGYSGLSYLKRFPIDTVKIDQSFIRDISVDADDAAIVRAIVAMARSLKLSVVAEGVETGEQLAFLSSLGCDFAQGYLLGRPMDAASMTALLRENATRPPAA
ncbi:MAG: EAL domain-containing protein [Betaproteobacteria bacterium]|nr:EAL domain-containing protein [Betaproteobacteria bacterium]